MTMGETQAQVCTGVLAVRRGVVPYPRYGCVTGESGDRVRVENAFCGDPRCSAEHEHGAELWPPRGVRAAQTYQARAGWEEGRLMSAVVPLR